MNISKSVSAHNQTGFTLIELLIVVVILAILAGILVPQFSSATDDAKMSSLDTNLSNTRSAIELYYQQHGHYPGSVTAIGTACAAGPGGSTGTGAINTEAAFLSQMSLYTNIAGEGCTQADSTFKYGPYMKKAAMPSNPFTDVSTVAISTTGALGMTSSVTNGGWKYDIKTGQFIANHSSYDDR
ncbi:MAG: prepilin-type N-terminal cleavage/methylation domain-containing protein [Gammaproteobacteria bacterium]|nr:prepilin-type N-terminal cleavage/methylation domain-containing protein [Gammaproteobacteria bacterium]